MSSSNLLKGSYIKDSGQRIIDFNDIISNKLEVLKKQAEEGNVNSGFVSGLSATVVESLISEDDEENIGNNAVDAIAADVSGQSGNNENSELAEDIISQAQEKADEIIANAHRQADSLMKTAERQGYDRGYSDGRTSGYADGCQKAEGEYSQRLKEVENERIRLNEEFKARYASMEPEIVGTILDVIENITGIVYDGNRDIIIHLINRVLEAADASGEYIIKVSRDDYGFVLGKQARLYAASSKDMNIDIIEDRNLSSGQCIIETDGGIFDCSLDVQMEQLVNDIRLLSSM